MTDENESISEIEAEFTRLIDAHWAQISKKLEESDAALTEAMRLAREYGIPFSSSVSHIDQAYIPDSYKEKFEKLGTNFVEALTGVSEYDLENSYGGWQHSSIC